MPITFSLATRPVIQVKSHIPTSDGQGVKKEEKTIQQKLLFPDSMYWQHLGEGVWVCMPSMFDKEGLELKIG